MKHTIKESCEHFLGKDVYKTMVAGHVGRVMILHAACICAFASGEQSEHTTKLRDAYNDLGSTGVLDADI